MIAPLIVVAEHAKRLPGRYGAYDVLTCGHVLIFDGSRPVRRRCTECAEPDPEEQPTLFDT